MHMKMKIIIVEDKLLIQVLKKRFIKGTGIFLSQDPHNERVCPTD